MKRFLVPIFLLVIWVGVHIPALLYGTKDLPLPMSYVGDEQAPVNGALHILAEKNLLALRNLKTVYYGPVFSLVAVPGVGLDFGEKYLRGQVKSSDSYRDFVLWDWGGIVWKERLIALLFGALGIWALFALLSTATLNPSRSRWLPWVGAALLATNFYYFEYASFFRHWAIIVPLLLCQLYCLVRFEETNRRRYWLWSLALFATVFGTSYVGALFQIMWLPLLVSWARNRDWTKLRAFGKYCAGVVCVVALVVLWHPHAFNRILGIVDSDLTNTSAAAYTTEAQATGYSLGYYSSMLSDSSLGFLIAIAVLLGYLSSKKQLRSKMWLWVIASPGLLFFAVFSLVSHHESRYMLPVIVLLVTLLGCLVAQYLALPNRPRLLAIALVTLVSFSALFHVVHIGRWLDIQAAGPKEQALASKLRVFQDVNPESKTLLFQYYIFGHVHTKEAYAAYAAETGKQNLNLYRAISVTPLPEDVVPLNLYYRRPDAPAPARESLTSYDQIILKFDPALEATREPDYFDVDPVRLWFYEGESEQYYFLR